MVNECPDFKRLFRATLDEAFYWQRSDWPERMKALLLWIREMRLKWRIWEVV
jgi:hypothetical protein